MRINLDKNATWEDLDKILSNSVILTQAWNLGLAVLKCKNDKIYIQII
jgi:hypothetical protein